MKVKINKYKLKVKEKKNKIVIINQQILYNASKFNSIKSNLFKLSFNLIDFVLIGLN